MILVYNSFYLTNIVAARSPLYAHLSNSLGGLTTIRSYGMQGDALEKYYHFQDENTKGWSLYIASIRWFGVRTDMMCACFVAVVTFASIRLAGSKSLSLADRAARAGSLFTLTQSVYRIAGNFGRCKFSHK